MVEKDPLESNEVHPKPSASRMNTDGKVYISDYYIINRVFILNFLSFHLNNEFAYVVFLSLIILFRSKYGWKGSFGIKWGTSQT